VVGAIIGSLIIGVINNGLVLVGVTPSIQLIIKGIVIILAVSLSRK
jgi:ribose transport system permease protein